MMAVSSVRLSQAAPKGGEAMLQVVEEEEATCSSTIAVARIIPANFLFFSLSGKLAKICICCPY